MPRTETREERRPKYSKRGALKMYVGGDTNPRTRYNCGVIEAARSSGVMVIRKPGKFGEPRMLHRPDLLCRFGQTHDRKDEGKYVKCEAVKEGGRVVVGAQNVNPYLAADGSYHMIVEAFHESARGLNRLTADVRQTREDGTHLVWRGPRNDADAVVATPWMTDKELYDIAVRLNRTLAARLRESKSPRPGVTARLDSFEKFRLNLDVMRRARRVKNLASGEEEEVGGATPYAMPLEQCGFSIDCAYMTKSIDANGDEVGEYYFRMAYGRSVPQSLTFEGWRGLGTDDKVAYVSEEVRQLARSAANATAEENGQRRRPRRR